MDKKMLQMDEQMAMELPSRDLMLVTIIITNLLNNNVVTIEVRNVDIAAQICAALLNNKNVDVVCEIEQ